MDYHPPDHDQELARAAALVAATPIHPPPLGELLAIARDHPCCETERARIEAGAVIVPIDTRLADGTWTIRRVAATNRAELLEALGY